MISFTCGTYHGLFVDTGVPSILPKDKSFFDFRTKGGRAVPKDSTPNLVIRYVSNVDTETHMLMVSLVYLAVEGSREGFVGFGSLLYGNSFTSDEVEKGVKSAIGVAKGASSFFNGKTISGRPTSHDGKTIDLTNLPLAEGGKFYAELVANINSNENIKELSEFLCQLISSGIDHYEIVVNPRRGMTPSDLRDHFNYLRSREKQEIEERREKLRRLKDRQRSEEIDREIERERLRNRNSFLLSVCAFGIAGTATLALAAFIAIKFVFADKRVDGVLVRNNDVSISDSSSILESELDRDSNLMQPVENSEVATCDLELLSDDDKLKNMIVSDLPTDGKCISVSESVTLLFTEQTLDHIVTSKNLDFRVSNETPEINQRLLTTFGRIVDSDLGSKYVDDANNFVLPDPSLSFAISMKTVSPRLFCTVDVAENNILDEEFPKFEYYTHFQNEYRRSLKWFSEGVLMRIGNAFSEIGKEIYLDEPDNSEVTSVGKKFKNVGKNLEYLAASGNLTLSTASLEKAKNTCVILVDEEDKKSFDKALPNQLMYSIDRFIRTYAVVPQKYSDLVEARSESACQKIPGMFMVWKSDLGARMIMENTIGFTPYTDTSGQDFDFIRKPAKHYGSADYKLPYLNKFDDLREYFVSDTDFSPFSPELYTRENFCYAPNPGGR